MKNAALFCTQSLKTLFYRILAISNVTLMGAHSPLHKRVREHALAKLHCPDASDRLDVFVMLQPWPANHVYVLKRALVTLKTLIKPYYYKIYVISTL